MELVVRKNDLLKELSLLQGIVERKNTIPILANVLIEAGKEGISLLATDLDVGLRSRCEGTIAKPGILTLPAKKLFEIVAALPDTDVRDICASFQRVAVETLVDRLFDAARDDGARSVGIAGGVSANRRLRHEATRRGAAHQLPVFIPPVALSTDNAAMIAAAGLRAFRAGVRGTFAMNADAALPLEPRTPNVEPNLNTN